MTDKKQQKMYDALLELSCREAVGFILNYCGRQLLDNNFYEALIDEGIIDDEDE